MFIINNCQQPAATKFNILFLTSIRLGYSIRFLHGNAGILQLFFSSLRRRQNLHVGMIGVYIV